MLNPRNKLYRWGPISACPLFMYFAIEPAFAPLKKLFGITYTDSVIIFKDGKVTWFLDDKKLSKQSKKFVDSVILNEKESKRYCNLWNKQTDKLLSVFSRLDKINFALLSKKEFFKSYREFKKSYYDWFVATISLELAVSSLEPLLGERLKKYYEGGPLGEFQKAFSTFTAPLTPTFYRQEQKDLLEIINLPQSKQNSAIKVHQSKYYWIYNSYAKGQVLNVLYFQKELEKSRKTNHKKTLEEINKYFTQIELDKRSIIKKLKLSFNDLNIVRQVETLSGLLDERKKYNFRSEHYLELFAGEFEKRLKRPLEDIKFFLPDELEMDTESVSPQVIKKRQECLVFVCTDRKIEQFTSKNALTIAGHFTGTTDINESIIHGLLASTGGNYYFRGTAKVVLTIVEIDKVKEGDVLVTTMTSPDFVIGMKKAGAIVTDVGGMLSHAAIISREFKKPCIVGTEIATKVIHDGDIIELHCEKGTVRIIKHAI